MNKTFLFSELMNSSDLKIFVAVVRQGGIVHAASALHRVPSAISTRIKQLESYLGSPLFTRDHRRLELTVEGKILYDYAVEILSLAERAENHIRARQPGGIFSLGAMDSMASSRLPVLLSELYQTHPDLELNLVTGISRFLTESLYDNQLDAAFIADVPEDDRFERTAVFEEELVIVAPCHHPRITTPHDIRCSTVLTFQDGCSYRGRLLNWYRDHQREPERVAVMSSYPVILASIAAGMGVGIVPVSLINSFVHQQSITIHHVSGMEKVTTDLIWRKGRFSTNIQALLDVIGTHRTV